MARSLAVKFSKIIFIFLLISLLYKKSLDYSVEASLCSLARRWSWLFGLVHFDIVDNSSVAVETAVAAP